MENSERLKLIQKLRNFTTGKKEEIKEEIKEVKKEIEEEIKEKTKEEAIDKKIDNELEKISSKFLSEQIPNNEPVFGASATVGGDGGDGGGAAAAAFDGEIKKIAQYSFDYYCAYCAAQIFSMCEISQYPNPVELGARIAQRVQIFASTIKSRFPGAFA